VDKVIILSLTGKSVITDGEKVFQKVVNQCKL